MNSIGASTGVGNAVQSVTTSAPGYDAGSGITTYSIGGGTDYYSNSVYNKPAYEGVFASGIDYVPRDMIAQLHRGETVTPANKSKGGTTINMGGITINGNVDPATTAKKLVSEMEKEMNRRNALRK